MIQRIHLNPAIEDCFPSHILFFCPWQSQCNAIDASFNGTRWGVGYLNVDIKYSITAWVECCPLLVDHWRCSEASLARWRGGEGCEWWSVSPLHYLLVTASCSNDLMGIMTGWWGDPGLWSSEIVTLGLDTIYFAHSVYTLHYALLCIVDNF